MPQPSEPGGSVLGARGKLVGAQLVGVDLETDLAVLKIQTDEPLPTPLRMGQLPPREPEKAV